MSPVYVKVENFNYFNQEKSQKKWKKFSNFIKKNGKMNIKDKPMLERKIYKRISDFYINNKNKALLITGARQVGKSYIIEAFVKEHYKSFIKVDFIENPNLVKIFDKAQSSEEILLRLSAIYGDKMIPGETLIFFDEIQEYPNIIVQIKYLLESGEYDYILSGSLLGTIFKDIKSMPVGYITIIQMFPLDFEEFAKANNVSDKVLHLLKQSFADKAPLDEFIHRRMLSLFELYLIVGGMPSVVETYIKTKNLRRVAENQISIIELYKKDISKYDKDEKLYLQNIFELIPSELNSKNKRFILKNLNENAKFTKYNNSFLWLKNAGVALTAFVANEPKIPLILSKSANLFKLFFNDVGLLAAMYGNNIQLKILNHETNINFGSIYENLVAQELTAHGFDLYFYNNKKLGEVDYLIESDGKIIPIEVKSGKDYYRHAAMDNLLNNKDYKIESGYVFCNHNIKVDKKTTYYPIYMVMFLDKKQLPNDIIYNEDFSDLNSLV